MQKEKLKVWLLPKTNEELFSWGKCSFTRLNSLKRFVSLNKPRNCKHLEKNKATFSGNGQEGSTCLQEETK